MTAYIINIAKIYVEEQKHLKARKMKDELTMAIKKILI